MEREVSSGAIDIDVCLKEAEELLVEKKYEKAKDKVHEARELLREIIHLDENDSSDIELERSKVARKTMTVPYSEKF